MFSIAAIVSDETVSHTMWRVTLPFKMLKSKGYDVQIINFPGSLTADGLLLTKERITEILAILEKEPGRFNAVLLPRIQIKQDMYVNFIEFVEQLHGLGLKVFYETDDDTFSNAWIEHWRESLVNHNNVNIVNMLSILHQNSLNDCFILNQVDGIIVSTENLKEVLQKITCIPIEVVPNAIDVDYFKSHLNTREDKTLTIGWAAGFRPITDAEHVAEAWTQIAKLYLDIKFSIAGYALPNLVNSVPKERLTIHPYTAMDSYQPNMQIDIACCSVEQTDFNRSRSPSKVYEFALAGAAVVATPFLYEEVISSKDFGLLAQSKDDWIQCLQKMIEDREYREITQRNLYKKVITEYSLKSNYRNWIYAWENLATLSS